MDRLRLRHQCAIDEIISTMSLRRGDDWLGESPRLRSALRQMTTRIGLD
jgi:hypothetical protein